MMRGPDYSFGWGIMNTEKAVKLIEDNQNKNIILEEMLNENETFSYKLLATQLKINITMVWTDPAGPIIERKLDNDKKILINDLDCKIIQDGEEILPWTLNKNNPSAAAQRADNDKDNVEKISFNSELGKEYLFIISHKNRLVDDKQDFSLVISGCEIVEHESFIIEEAKIFPNPTSEEINFSFLAKTGQKQFSYL